MREAVTLFALHSAGLCQARAPPGRSAACHVARTPRWRASADGNQSGTSIEQPRGPALRAGQRGLGMGGSCPSTQANEHLAAHSQSPFGVMTREAGGLQGMSMTQNGQTDSRTNNGIQPGETRPNLPLQLGRLVITPGVHSLNATMTVAFAVAGHKLGRWGQVPIEDHEANNRALDLGERILSVYSTRDGTKFWIITEADRSQTTVLLPEEY